MVYPLKYRRMYYNWWSHIWFFFPFGNAKFYYGLACVSLAPMMFKSRTQSVRFVLLQLLIYYLHTEPTRILTSNRSIYHGHLKSPVGRNFASVSCLHNYSLDLHEQIKLFAKLHEMDNGLQTCEERLTSIWAPSQRLEAEFTKDISGIFCWLPGNGWVGPTFSESDHYFIAYPANFRHVSLAYAVSRHYLRTTVRNLMILAFVVWVQCFWWIPQDLQEKSIHPLTWKALAVRIAGYGLGIAYGPLILVRALMNFAVRPFLLLDKQSLRSDMLGKHAIANVFTLVVIGNILFVGHSTS